ncbi:MAG: hypothetical protein AVDCRST_MAG34-3117 [uncultured Nocardioidaceae bacterium]|uniref:DUF421 domain-containing protein n=1 Tax=uncultured Nocardioidaceae bacterium TaxID=253824 RepID=A0A6J4MUZ2_9ACTN|nr:MAG: hypothetical protein AVDCRST_MAG34-3117 [uncultured Nocardioidaceae bacterium]
MWFDSWNDVLRIVLVGGSAYGLLVLLLRLSGKRTLAKLNAFDFVVTIALGSTLATILLDSRTSLVDGLVALGLLVVLQFLVAAVTARLPRLRTLVTAGPTVLLLDGEPRPEVMRRHRVSLDELHQAVRSTGTGDLALVAGVVLETDGTMSIISTSKAGDRSLLPEEGARLSHTRPEA